MINSKLLIICLSLVSKCKSGYQASVPFPPEAICPTDFQRVNISGERYGTSNEIARLFLLTTESDLNIFIQNNVQPSKEFYSQCQKQVEMLIRFLKIGAPGKLRIQKISVGGSTGKGTDVKDVSDIDLVLLLYGYTRVRDLASDMAELLSTLEQYLLGYNNVIVVAKRRRSLEVELRCRGRYWRSVDIVLGVDVFELGPSRDQVYEEMVDDDADMLKYHSPSFVPAMLNMFYTLPAKLKTLIRLVKYWKGQTMTDKHVRWPSSYGFELVTIYAWTVAGRPSEFVITRALHEVLQLLVHHEDFRADFGNMTFYNSRFLKIPCDGPYIIDPLDPNENLYSRRNWNWEQTSAKAREWLQRPLFHGMLRSTVGNWRI